MLRLMILLCGLQLVAAPMPVNDNECMEKEKERYIRRCTYAKDEVVFQQVCQELAQINYQKALDRSMRS